ncbi:hypothetical protein SAMN05443575_2430 [Jatrophihabitans endophyticus]|uniref:Uncharacterized protein n=1 Tax=Jatrophihabitans endophyticus TaxID=1206085 RepID=A0A1M5LEW9_9ACTN|nr:hypothetical protein [Jatrophihabitans endophyticus]SHG63538.1 hypothetical protein SAMN05443575_2430 [Jatrophihabitans endophyticus]
MHDDDVRETPPAVVGAVSIGTAPLPFLAVYAVLFILHGTISPAHPPDITSTQTGELIAGIVAAVVFVVLATTLWLFLNGRYRWPFVVGQLVVLVTTAWFLVDDTAGGVAVSALVCATSLVALVLGFAPGSWRHVRRPVPALVGRAFREDVRSGEEATPAEV